MKTLAKVLAIVVGVFVSLFILHTLLAPPRPGIGDTVVVISQPAFACPTEAGLEKVRRLLGAGDSEAATKVLLLLSCEFLEYGMNYSVEDEGTRLLCLRKRGSPFCLWTTRIDFVGNPTADFARNWSPPGPPVDSPDQPGSAYTKAP